MNKWIGIGRVTKEIEVRYTQGAEPIAVCKFSIACDRKKKDDGADFINITAFKSNAEFAGKYFTKGTKIVCEGYIHNDSYEKDGKKVYTSEIIAEHFEFAESKKSGDAPKTDADGFMNIPDGIDEDLPFAVPSTR